MTPNLKMARAMWAWLQVLLAMVLCPVLLHPVSVFAGEASLRAAPTGVHAPPKLVKKLEQKQQREKEKLKRFDQPDKAQEYYRLKRSLDGKSPVPVKQYFKALDQIKKMPRYSTASAQRVESTNTAATTNALPAWTPLGPGNIGGRTRAMLIDPLNPSILYAAGVAGGVWKTTNGGASWSPLSDLLPNIAVSSMAMDPDNSGTIYAGTGEGYFNFDSVRGAGIFKTTNGGTSWSQLATTDTSNFYYVNDLAVSPNNSSRVYAATSTGLWRSLDSGGTWTRVLNPNVSGGCLDLAIRTDRTTDYLFASCGNFAQATIYRNIDAGSGGSWTPVFTEAGMGRTALAIAPSNQGVIYALASEIDTASQYYLGLHAVFRSTSSGDSGSWTAQVRNTATDKLNTVLLSNPVFAFYSACFGGTEDYFYNQGWYDNVIAVDPADSNIVWTGGIDLFRSDDGGVNWGMASHWWADKTNPRYNHADDHVIVFDPRYNGTTNKVMYTGNDGGIHRTNDARAATATGTTAPCSTNNGSVTWTELNNSYAVTQFYFGLPYPDLTTYFGGTQDNGTIRGSNASGINGWATISGGDGGYVAIDPDNINVLYDEFTGLSLQKSTDGGVTFSPVTTGITENGSNFLFITPFTMDSSDAQRLWIGGYYIWRTTNGAASWTQASAITAGNGSVSSLAIAATDGNYALAGMSDGYIHRTATALSNTASTNWPSVQPRSGYVSWVAFDPVNPNIAYATYSTFGGTHVWKSVDAGANWTGIDGSGGTAIPDIPVHSIVVDPTNAARLYVGTDLGVFVSTNGGASWAVENTGFATAVTEALVLRNNTLFAFTHGRGAWKVPVSGSSVVPPGDFTGDGKADILWRNYATGADAVWRMNNTSFVASTSILSVADPNWQLAGTGDFTSDGKPDLLWRYQGPGTNQGRNVIWQMNGTSFVTSLALPTVSNLDWQVGGVGDYSGDGKPDILWRNYRTGANSVWRMNGTTFTSSVSLLGVANLDWQMAASGNGDFNADGKTDLLWRNRATGQTVVWLMNGTTYVSTVSLPTVGDSNWQIGGVADYSGDAKPDILWRNYATGANVFWLMNGTGYSSTATLPAVTTLDWRISGPR